MIGVIDEKPIPIYEATCPECGSTLEYTAASVAFSHITCPVCRCSMWAMTLRPKRYQDRTVERSGVGKIVRCKDCEYYTEDERWCRRLGLCGAFDPDDYCSHAERSEDATN